MVWLDVSDLYLFHLIVLLNPVFSCYKSLLSVEDDKLTTGTYNLQSVILKTAFVGLLIPTTAGSASGLASLVALLVNTQFSDQLRVKDTSQLINGMSSVLQKVLKYFNDTTISISSFSTIVPSNFPVILVLLSKDFESLME